MKVDWKLEVFKKGTYRVKNALVVIYTQTGSQVIDLLTSEATLMIRDGEYAVVYYLVKEVNK